MRIKALQIALLFMLLTVFIRTVWADEPKEKFLDQAALQIVSSAPDLYAGRLSEMHFYPTITPHGLVPPYTKKKLSPSDRVILVDALSKSSRINPKIRLQQCHYEPGFKITFAKEQKSLLSILVCFNCGLWALSQEDIGLENLNDQHQILSYGDLRPYRAELIQVARRLFPDVESFKKLK